MAHARAGGQVPRRRAEHDPQVVRPGSVAGLLHARRPQALPARRPRHVPRAVRARGPAEGRPARADRRRRCRAARIRQGKPGARGVQRSRGRECRGGPHRDRAAAARPHPPRRDDAPRRRLGDAAAPPGATRRRVDPRADVQRQGRQRRGRRGGQAWRVGIHRQALRPAAADRVGEADAPGLSELDGNLQDWVVTHRFEPLDQFFVALSRLGYGGAIWILIAVGLALVTRRPTVAALAAATIWSADLLALAIKVPVDRPRPFIVDPQPPPLLIGVLGDSFPSAHAATSFAGALVLTRWLPGRWPFLFGLALAIAYSRVYVGVHYPGDVLAGAAIGLIAATALPRLVTALRRPPPAPPRG